MLNDPVTWDERRKAAEDFLNRTKLSIPTLIDNMDNKTDSDYKAWPDRIYIVGTNGKIIYKGEPGPKGLKPSDIADTLGPVTKVASSGKSAIAWGAIKNQMR